MSYGAEFARLALAHLLAVASPGPDFAVVLRQSIVHGRRAGILTALGIGTGNSVHVLYSLFGLAYLSHRVPAGFVAVKWLGAGYLAYLGIRCLRARGDGFAPAEGAGAARLQAAPAGRQPFFTGLWTNLLNPKCTLFFVAFFAALVSPATPGAIKAGYGLWICLSTAAWFSAVALLLTREPVRRAFLRCGRWIDRALGVVLIAFAVLLAI